MKTPQIFYGDIGVNLRHQKTNKFGRQIVDDSHLYVCKNMVYSMIDDGVLQSELLMNRIKKQLPEHLKNYTIESVEKLTGQYLGDANYVVQ